MPLGPNTLTNVFLPVAWDTAELTRVQLRDGTSAAQAVADFNSALAVFNGTLTGADNYLTMAMGPATLDLGVEYTNGTSNGVSAETEFAQPDAMRGETTGHMLPLRGWDRKLEWTLRYLEECRMAQLENDVADAIKDFKNNWDKQRLTRLFKSGEETGRTYGLGASGVSVPLCNGSVQTIGGSASTVLYTPPENPERATAAFTTSHSHYLRLDGITQANLETAVAHLWEHGHDAPYELIVAQADVADWRNTTNVTGFSKRANAQIQYGTTTQLATVGDMYIGAVETNHGTCLVYATGRVPTKYWAVYKSYGALDQRNPIAVRYDEVFGFGAKLVINMVSLHPFYGAIGRMRFGVGIGRDRTNGVVVRNHTSGNYSDPTIS